MPASNPTQGPVVRYQLLELYMRCEGRDGHDHVHVRHISDANTTNASVPLLDCAPLVRFLLRVQRPSQRRGDGRVVAELQEHDA